MVMKGNIRKTRLHDVIVILATVMRWNKAGQIAVAYPAGQIRLAVYQTEAAPAPVTVLQIHLR